MSSKITDFGAFSQNNFIEYKEKGKHYFIRNQDIKDMFISDNKIFINEDVYDKLTLKLEEYDLLLQRTGSIGKTGMVLEKDLPSSANQNLAQVKLNLKEINPYYVNTFLNSSIGKNIFDRLATGNVQPWLNLGQIESIKVPIFSTSFQLIIENLVKLSFNKQLNSKLIYKQAEELLLKELDLLNFKPSKEKVAIKSFNESFGSSGRPDSEYYQPKYDDIINKIKSKKYDKLGNIVNIFKSVEPGSQTYQENGIPFVRVSNLTKFGLSSSDIHLSNNLFDEEVLKKLRPKKDTILLSKDGTVGIAYNVKDETNIITSGAILHLTIKDNDVLPEYLTLVLNSLIVQMQSQRDAGGSIIKHWKPSEIQEVLIPIIDKDIQEKIEEKIKESFILKEKSKELLEIAKKVVEIAIEEDEEKAREFIDKNTLHFR